jgi:hypothetical protein
MKTVTFPYGTTRKGSVVDVIRGTIIITDENMEGHILTKTCCPQRVRSGDVGTLTFTKGGPTGGYWKFEKED